MTEVVKDVKECPRLDISMLYTYLSDTVEDILKRVSFEDFVGNIETLDQIKKSTKKKVYQQFIETVKKDVLADLEHCWEESGITERDVMIKKLIQDQIENKDKICWRPKTGDCQDNLNPYLIKLLREKKKKLEDKLSQQKKLRLEKEKQVDHKREAFQKRVESIKNCDDKLEKYSDFFVQEITTSMKS